MVKLTHSKLAVRLTLLIVISTTAILFILGLIQFRLELSSLNKKLFTERAIIADRITYSVRQPVWDFDMELTSTLLENEVRDDQLVGAVVTLSDGSYYSGKVKVNSRGQELIRNWRTGDEESVLGTLPRLKRQIFYSEGRELGSITIYFSTHPLNEAMTRLIQNYFLTALINTALISVILILVFRGMILNRLMEISRFVSQFGDKDFQSRIPVHSDDELGLFTEKLNLMADKLNHSFQAMKTAEEKLLDAHSRLEEYNRNLEQRVQERTIELETANSALSQKNLQLKETIQKLNDSQNQIIQSEKMAALGQLVAGIAHELNTPLGAIISTNHILKNRLYHSIIKNGEFLLTLSRRDSKLFGEFFQECMKIDLLTEIDDRQQMKAGLEKELSVYTDDSPELLADWLIDMNFVPQDPRLEKLMPHPRFHDMIRHAYSISSMLRSALITQNAAEKASRFVKALKTYSHHDSQDVMKTTDLISSLEMVLTLYQNQTKHAVIIHRNFEQHVSVDCYPEKIYQVWSNLISNALQAMQYKGELTIDVTRTEQEALVTITDNGPGIPKEIQLRIFEPFFTTKSPGEGSGLGLEICRRIVQEINGYITFESRPGNTAFTVHLKPHTD